MKDLNRNIARNIKHYLDMYQMQQLDLAKKLNCANSTVSSWIQGDSTPRMEKIDKMCEVFHCSRTDLIAEEPKTENEIISDQVKKMFIKKFDNLTQEQKLRLLAYMENLK